jgi:hypothetical protein
MSQDVTPPAAPPAATPATREEKLKLYDRVLATVSALGLIVGGVWGVYTYSHTRQREIDQKSEEAKRAGELKGKEILLRKHELDLMIFKERKEAYFALCDAACEIAACRDRKEVVDRSRAYLQLYYGRAHIIADSDDDVSEKKVAFKERLMEYLYGKSKDSTELPFTFFGNDAYALTHACRKHVDPRSLATIVP